MKENSKKFRMVDALLIAMMIVPLVIAMVIKVLTTPATEGIEIAGARILCTIPMPIQDLIISEAQVNAWLIMITILGFCLFITHGLKEDKRDWRQMAAEWIVEKLDQLVQNSMEDVFMRPMRPLSARSWRFPPARA